MQKRTVYAIVIGAILFTLGIVLKKVADQEGPQILLFFLTFLVMGVVAGGVKRSFLLGLVMGVIFTLINGVVNITLSFQNASVAVASIIIGVIIPSLIGSGLSALGGLVGRKLFKQK